MRIVEFAPIGVEPVRPDTAALDLKTLVDAYERKLIVGALALAGGNQRNAAEKLGVLPSTLHEKIKRLGIRLNRVRKLDALEGNDPKAALLWTGRIAAGGTLEVRGLNGLVRIDASEDDQVEVAATHAGARATRFEVELKVLEHRHGVSVWVVRQGPEPAAPEIGGDVFAAEVDIVARVPPGVHVVASTINGDVEVVGLAGNVEAGTTNGHVIFLPGTR